MREEPRRAREEQHFPRRRGEIGDLLDVRDRCALVERLGVLACRLLETAERDALFPRRLLHLHEEVVDRLVARRRDAPPAAMAHPLHHQARARAPPAARSSSTICPALLGVAGSTGGSPAASLNCCGGNFIRHWSERPTRCGWPTGSSRAIDSASSTRSSSDICSQRSKNHHHARRASRPWYSST